MRILIAAMTLLAASPAVAQQDWDARARANELQLQLDMERQRLNALQNETFAAETRLRTEQTLRSLEAAREPLRVTPAERRDAGSLKPPPEFAEIPDAALAGSNARVRAVAR